MPDKALKIAPDPVMVNLGNQEYAVKPLVWGKVFKLKRLMKEALEEFDRVIDIGALLRELSTAPQEGAVEGSNAPRPSIITNAKVWDALDVLLQQPYAFLKLSIPSLDEKLFAEDNDEGATVDQVVEAIGAVLEVNHLSILKNRIAEAWGGLMGETSPTTSSLPPSATNTN